ncbi:MAG TPA: hypothetical protein VFN28_08995, partial [Amaricoccus sp.]|nr:hypothetical protein [Amaricoccus sp.]
MHQLTQSPRDPAFVQDPYPFYDRARATGPLFLWEDYGFPCAAGHAEVSLLLRDRRFGRELPEALKPRRPPHLADFYRLDDRSMLDREPPSHTRLRGLVLRAFTSRRIAALAPDITSVAEELIAPLPREFDLITAFAEPLPVRIIARLLGVPEEMAPQLLAWSHAMVAMYQARRDRAVEAAANAAARDFSAFLTDHIAARRARPADDLVTALVAAEAEGSPPRRRRARRHLRPPPQRRPRGDGARDRRRHGRDPRRRPRPGPHLRHARGDRGHRRGDPPLRPPRSTSSPATPSLTSSSSATASAPATP